MTHWKQKVAMRHLITMVIDKICKMTVKGVKLKSESFLFNISWRFGVMEENLRGAESAPPGMDRVKDPNFHP